MLWFLFQTFTRWMVINKPVIYVNWLSEQPLWQMMAVKMLYIHLPQRMNLHDFSDLFSCATSRFILMDQNKMSHPVGNMNHNMHSSGAEPSLPVNNLAYLKKPSTQITASVVYLLCKKTLFLLKCIFVQFEVFSLRVQGVFSIVYIIYITFIPSGNLFSSTEPSTAETKTNKLDQT